MFKGTINSSIDHVRAWNDSLFVDHAIFRLVWSNFAAVIEGKVYRCNHPPPRRLERLKKRYQLKTLINLRGYRQCGSDALSRRASQALGLIHTDMAFESRGAPHKERILRFYDIYQKAKFPLLMHCKSGADRAGLASGLVIMFEGGTARQALKHLHWSYGHFKGSRTGILDGFFLQYQTEAEGCIPFIEWVTAHYDEKKLKENFTAHHLASFMTDHILKRE